MSDKHSDLSRRVANIFSDQPLDISDAVSDYLVMQHHADLIDQLGGGTEVAVQLWGTIGLKGRHREAVYKWKHNGIPWRWRPTIARLASERGLGLPPGFLLPVYDGGASSPDASF